MSDLLLSYVRLERAPDAEDRTRWNVTYEAGENCQLHRDELGWVWISQVFRETLRDQSLSVRAETKMIPPHLVAFGRPAMSPMSTLRVGENCDRTAERPEVIAARDTMPEIVPTADVGAIAPGQVLASNDPSYRHPKAKRR